MNYYKISTGFLAIALVVLFIVYLNGNKINTDSLSNQKTRSSPEIVEYLNDLNFEKHNPSSNLIGGIDPIKTGAFISLDDAKKKYNRFINRDTLPQGSVTEAYAFAFGIENLKEFVKKLVIEAPRSGSDSMKITGVRAYVVLTPYKKDTTKYYYDLLMLPVQSNGNDYRQIDTKNFLESDSLILNTSAPCPNNCDSPGLLPLKGND